MSGRQQKTTVNRGMVVGWALAITVSMVASWLIGLRIVGRASAEIPKSTQSGMLEHKTFEGLTADPLQVSARELLHSYGWVDQTRSRARVPIERGKALYLERAGAADGGK